MLTDSSAEASALGSGPRGRRFKSALSEKRPSIVIVQRNRGNPLYLHLKMTFFQVFFLDVCTTYRGKQLEFTFHCTTLLRKFLLCKTVARQALQNDRDIRLFIWPVRCILH